MYVLLEDDMLSLIPSPKHINPSMDHFQYHMQHMQGRSICSAQF